MSENVQYDVLIVSDTRWCGLYAAMMCVNLVCLYVLLFIGARFERPRVYRGGGDI
jgi:hypothetical protein